MSDSSSTVLMLAILGLLGLAIGSFLNVVIHRLPRGESLASPPSRCPACGHAIRPRHNVPVVSWVLLRGRCADCGAPISPRYPLVEVVTCALFVMLSARIVALDLGSSLPAYLWFAAAGVALAGIDLDTKRLPDVLVYPSYGVVALALTVSAAIEGSWWPLARAGLGAAALFGCFLALALIRPDAMGFGDVKLSGLVGGVLGYLSWAAVAVGGLAAFVLGAAVGIALLVGRRADRKTALPFGPFLIAGAILAILAADPLADAYLDLVRR